MAPKVMKDVPMRTVQLPEPLLERAEFLMEEDYVLKGSSCGVPRWAWRALQVAAQGKTQGQLAKEIGISRQWANQVLQQSERVLESSKRS